MNIDYKVVHNVKELKESAKDGYEFVAIITPNDWIMEKREEESIGIPREINARAFLVGEDTDNDSVPVPIVEPTGTIGDPPIPIPNTTADSGISSSKAISDTNPKTIKEEIEDGAVGIVYPKTIKQIKDGKGSSKKST